VASNFVIGPGDILQISVWQEPQFGETVEVRPDGKISLPLVSDVKVAGLTPATAQQKIAEKLQDFVKHPLVTVVVTQVHSRMVYVIGEVERPGPYPMVSPINVEQLIARAGGPTSQAKQKQVYILHEGVSQKIPVNYKKIMQGKAPEQNVELMPGDTVVVP
jgi:polysaccharide export outer membrane protein